MKLLLSLFALSAAFLRTARGAAQTSSEQVCHPPSHFYNPTPHPQFKDALGRPIAMHKGDATRIDGNCKCFAPLNVDDKNLQF